MLDAQCIPHDDALLERQLRSVLGRRRELIADRLNMFLGTDGMRVSGPEPDPYVKQLDARVERVELSVRALIETELGGDATLLPSHITERLRDKVNDAVRRNPAVASSLDLLEGKLQYCDFASCRTSSPPRLCGRGLRRSSAPKKHSTLGAVRSPNCATQSGTAADERCD